MRLEFGATQCGTCSYQTHLFMIPFAVTANPSNEQLSFLKDYPWLGVEEKRVRVRLESSPAVPEALVTDRMADAMETHEDNRHLSKHCIVSLSLCDCSDTVTSCCPWGACFGDSHFRKRTVPPPTPLRFLTCGWLGTRVSLSSGILELKTMYI